MCLYVWNGEKSESELIGKQPAGELEDFPNAVRTIGPDFQMLIIDTETYMCGPCPTTKANK